ncbi:MAG: hypothetical protein JNK63_04125 [Chthonomonas sp.]|nr:hypothetical protein [Chthonomonas sp.]
MSICHVPPSDKRGFIDQVGQELTARYGKKKQYSQPQIARAVEARGYQPDYACWAYSVFMDGSDFVHFHQQIGELCNYDLMRTTMLEDIAPSLGFSLPDFGGLNFDWSTFDFSSFEWPSFDWPDIDLSGFFDWSP